MSINISHIAQGFINSTKAKFNIADIKVEELATKRYEICLKCPFINDTKTRCSKDKGGPCNCFLDAKTRSDSVCYKWKNIK